MYFFNVNISFDVWNTITWHEKHVDLNKAAHVQNGSLPLVVGGGSSGRQRKSTYTPILRAKLH